MIATAVVTIGMSIILVGVIVLAFTRPTSVTPAPLWKPCSVCNDIAPEHIRHIRIVPPAATLRAAERTSSASSEQ